jgi:hypothetical protein
MKTSGKNLVDYIAQLTAMESHINEVLRWEIATYMHNPISNDIDSLEGIDEVLRPVLSRLRDARKRAERKLFQAYDQD